MMRSGANASSTAASTAYKLSPRCTYSRTTASISAGEASCGMREWMTTGFVRARGGKSHSWLTPTISRSNPSANSISVADGSNDTIRITSKTLSQFEKILFIEEILAADLLESREAVRPAGDDFVGSHAGLQLLDGI